MRRSFLLPALAACAMLAVGAPVASAAKAHSSAKAHSAASATPFLLKAVKNLQSKVGALEDIAKGYRDAFATIHSALDPIVAGVPQVLAGLVALKDGLTKLSDAVQGPGVAGQLGAAGTAAPGSSNSATPSTLPTGTVYRQIVIATGGNLNTAPIGARTYVRMPDVAALGYSNTWVCTGAGTSSVASNEGGTGHGYTVTCAGGAAAEDH